VVGRFLGFSSMQSFQYSFLIAWPLMFAAWVKGSYDLFSTQRITQLLSGDIVLSMVIATVISWYCLQQIAKIIEKKQVHYLAWWLFLVAFVAFFTVKV
jgi:undecaprenyl pyrophosphate phosphatase UppP